jgi:HAD superfamily hydrolase (TIGR01450 family)
MPLADSYDGFLIDLDGTVWVGGEAVPGAAEALAALRAAGRRLVFVTNDSRASGAELAERLRESGIEAGPEDVLTAGAVTARAAARTGARRAYVIGASALKRAVREAGAELCEPEDAADAEVVVVALHPGFDYEELRAATRALHAGAALFATNREPSLPMPDGHWPGTGAILAAVEFAGGRRATICGKPERELFEQALERIGTSPQRSVIVGDGLRSDIAGAAAAGIGTILVLTGNASRDEAGEADPRPDHVLESIAELTGR